MPKWNLACSNSSISSGSWRELFLEVVFKFLYPRVISKSFYQLSEYFSLNASNDPIRYIFRTMCMKSKVEACKVLGLILVIVSLSHCMSGRTEDIASGLIGAFIDAILILG